MKHTGVRLRFDVHFSFETFFGRHSLYKYFLVQLTPLPEKSFAGFFLDSFKKPIERVQSIIDIED